MPWKAPENHNRAVPRNALVPFPCGSLVRGISGVGLPWDVLDGGYDVLMPRGAGVAKDTVLELGELALDLVRPRCVRGSPDKCDVVEM